MKSLPVLFFVLMIASVLLPHTPVQSQSCFELVWSDEFNYEGLPDSSIWSYEVGASGWGNNELQYYTLEREENARVEDGNLIIEARRENFLGASYTSARLITYDQGHSFRYGKIEARIKLPYGQGIWPAFWMLGNGIFEGTPWPACGEIDIMEMVGGGEGRDDKVYGTIHWADAGGNHAEYGGNKQLSEGIFADNFHVFSVEWNATTIKWFLDGVQYHTVDITPSHMTEFHKDFFILLNIAVGGNWPGNPNSGTVFPQKMYVDYIRVYQTDGTPAITGPGQVTKGQSGVRFSTIESGDMTYNWSVPENAVITGGQGTHSILVDWICDTGSVQLDIIGACDQYSLNHKVNLKKLEIAGLDRIEAFTKDLNYAIPVFRDASYQWNIPQGVSPNTGLDSILVNVNWNEQDGEISVNISGLCGADSAAMMVSTVLQQPYPDPNTPHAIPGTISPVHYDSGGEGISYHDSEPENLGPGSRQDEGVDTEINDKSETIGWLEPGEWTEYTVDVNETGSYDIDFRVASINSLGKFRVLFNGEDRTGEISVPNTGAWSSFTTVSLENIPLKKSDSLMRVSIINGLFNLGRMIFREATTGVNEYVPDRKGFYLYPIPAGEKISIRNLNQEHSYRILEMTGRMVDKGKITQDSQITISSLKPGAYILILEDSATLLYSERFLISR